MKDDLKDLRELDLPFDVDKVDPQCHKCIRDQLEKYKNHVSKDGTAARGKFIVPCKGVKKEILDDVTKSQMTDDQVEYTEAVNDIVKFADTFLKLPGGKSWNARWYQQEVLRCTSKRKVLRIARRCVVPGTPVLMNDGNWKNIEDIKVGDYVASRNKKNQLVGKKVTLEHNNGVKDVYEIRLSNGMKVACTSNHPLLSLETLETGRGTRKVWKSIEDGLCVGTKVVVAKNFDKWGELDNPDLLSLFGYMLTDGYFGNKEQTPKFTNNNTKMINEVALLSKRLFDYSCSIRKKENGFDIHITDGNKKTENKFSKVLEDLGLHGIKAKRKYLPSDIYRYNKRSQMLMINRMFSGDGGVSVWKDKKSFSGEVFLVSSSKQLLEQIKLILRKIDIESYISKDERDINVLNRGKVTHSITYKLRIGRANSIESFFKHVGFIFGKEEQCSRLLDVVKTKKKRRRKGYIQFRHETIKSIKYKGKSQTYDIGVEDTHNFIADGIVNHNTGKTDLVCVEICYYLFTEENLKILVAGPQKTHTEEIINRVRSFIRNNPILSDSVVRDVSSPFYEIILKNGSRIRGYAAGTKGKDGVSIRGQDADRIYLEEMQYIDDTAIRSSVLPILQTTPDTTLVGFSTPSGFRTTYYTLCKQSPRYKEFQFDYKVLPWWREIEAERDSFTEEEWEHEQLAKFGSTESGVYKPSHIDNALEEYKYEDMRRVPTWKYTIGTDWNEKYGTEIVVLGYNTFSGMFKVVEALHIEKSEFTQLMGVTKLIEMNRKWSPDFVYIDAGNGSTNYELLMKTAYKSSVSGGDVATARLLTTLKKYDAGSSIEIKESITNEKRRAPAKSFMVNASVRMFEQNRIKISTHDIKLDAQLRNYIIERYTPTGNPVYGLNDPKTLDHRLDALNLAIVAFDLNFGELHRQRIMTDIGIAEHPSSLNKDEHGRIISGRPPARAMTGNSIKNDWEKQLFPMMPGHIDNGLEGIKTNRPGWATDEEDLHIQKFIQRRRSRGNLGPNRPKRTKF